MSEDKSYNQIRSIIDTQTIRIQRPLQIDTQIGQLIRQHDINPVVIEKLLVKINLARLKKLKRVYNKQAIHLVSLQLLNGLKVESLAKFKKFLDLNMLLIPFKISDMDKQNEHEFKLGLLEKAHWDSLLELIEELPNSNELIPEMGLESGEQQLDEILQKYDYIINELIKNIKLYRTINTRLDKYCDFLQLISRTLDVSKIQKNLILSSNTQIIEQINRSRILMEKVGRKLDVYD